MRKAIQHYSCTVCYLLPHVVLLLLLPHAIQFATCYRTPYSYVLLPHAIQFTIYYCTPQSCLLLHAVQFAACCCTPYSLLFGAAHHTVAFCCRMPYSLLLVATCRTICYLWLLHTVAFLPHTVQLFLLPYAVQFAICCLTPYSCFSCRMLYTLLFAAAHRTVATCCCMLYILLFVAACHTVAIYCRMLYSLLFVAACRKICYLLPHTVQLATATACYRVCYSLHHTMHAVPYVLLHVLQFAIGCRIPVQFAARYRKPYSLLLVAACPTVPYLLLHALQIAICCSMPCSMPHVLQLTVCCSMSYNQLFVTCVVHLVVYLCTVQHNLGEIGRSKLLNKQQY